MSITLQIMLIAGAVFATFIVLGLVIWSIRIRREEDGFVPAPPKPPKSMIRTPYTVESEQAVADWMSPPTKEIAEPILPSGKLLPDDDFGSPFKSLLRSAMPELSTLIELGKMVKESQAAEGASNSPEERNAALRQAVDRMLEQNPDSDLLRQLRSSLPSAGEIADATIDDSRVQVYEVDGKKTVLVDGANVTSADDILDPVLREKIQRLLDSLDENE
jgi:hypothetical protein